MEIQKSRLGQPCDRRNLLVGKSHTVFRSEEEKTINVKICFHQVFMTCWSPQRMRKTVDMTSFIKNLSISTYLLCRKTQNFSEFQSFSGKAFCVKTYIRYFYQLLIPKTEQQGHSTHFLKIDSHKYSTILELFMVRLLYLLIKKYLL